jgi:ribosomal protein L16 Arg81 hydroxylase
MPTKDRPELFKSDFWSSFSKKYWEKKPVTLKRVASEILAIDADHIFELLVRYANHCRKTKSFTSQGRGGLKLFVAGKLQAFADALHLLPTEKDGSLEGYHRRMGALFPDYCLVCDELLQVSLEKWDVLGTFMQGLYEHVGIPNRFSEIGLYLGNYRQTPFGVHVDPCGVISLPVVGTKRFRLWTPDVIKKHPELKYVHEYDRYKKYSKLMVAKPGDVTYWPSSYWHIAESDGSFSATWSIGTWVDRPYKDVLVQSLESLMSEKLKADLGAKSIQFRKLHRKDGFVEGLPDIFRRSISMFRELPEKELHDTFLRFWLEQTSKRGFKIAPQPALKARLSRGDRVRGRTNNPIQWAKLASGRLCLAINGVLVETPRSPKTAKLVQSLNTGKTIALDRTMAASDFKLLQTFHRANGLTVV